MRETELLFGATSESVLAGISKAESSILNSDCLFRSVSETCETEAFSFKNTPTHKKQPNKSLPSCKGFKQQLAVVCFL